MKKIKEPKNVIRQMNHLKKSKTIWNHLIYPMNKFSISVTEKCRLLYINTLHFIWKHLLFIEREIYNKEMIMKKKNRYGYKIGYRENGSRNFIRYFMTYTYPQAKMCLRHYRKSPPRERETNRPLINPFWEIKPITKKEILAGIWDEIPFPYSNLFLLFWRGSFAYPSQNCITLVKS